MVKKSSSRLENMPSNLINKATPRPVTLPQYMVVDANGDILFKENRLWYAIDNAGRRDAKGETVDVLGWDEFAAKHRPIGEFMTKVNAHGDVEGDWRAVYNQRNEAARAKRKTAPKSTKAVKRDDKTADSLKEMSMILNVAASAMRRGDLPEDQLSDLYKQLDDLTSHIYELLPEPVIDLETESELTPAE